mmetsp:Transcript_9686/g.11229  ORF Transcript_9686/g.11229 Transcript_9686/m.11229 type:complete len:231 (-) Transcript_9686:573-1265(-)|eukprot:CAMPEP_0197861338 /NCGR_PEP_ID=MMETSP1438-20131217/37330_1 /TAXON_ID=1461541 /ORGANISM="Pterosperma sp., Strain CCMP1384" /LENGTH=230 /DNA_ID=CAMNT_0043478479 /DNA_START=72 /DNA_END=764 /DNA_ORIENTATION=+
MKHYTFLLAVLATVAFRVTLAKAPPTLPDQFSATVQLTAHRVDKEKPYPEHERTVKVVYDLPNKRFKTEEEDRQKVMIRRYDLGMEVQLLDLSHEETETNLYCTASKLKSAEPPLPAWPTKAVYEGEDMVNGVKCDRWREDFGTVSIDIYINAKTGAPVRVQVETIEQTEPVRLSKPDMTYDWSNFKAGAAPLEDFELPEELEEWEESCQWQPNNIGFPYFHMLHHYYRI